METEKGTYDGKLLSRARTVVKHTSDDEPLYMPLDDTVPFPRVMLVDGQRHHTLVIT